MFGVLWDDLLEYFHMDGEQFHRRSLDSFLTHIRDRLHRCLDSHKESLDLVVFECALILEGVRKSFRDSNDGAKLGFLALKLLPHLLVHLVLRLDQKFFEFGPELFVEYSDQVPDGALNGGRRPSELDLVQQFFGEVERLQNFVDLSHTVQVNYREEGLESCLFHQGVRVPDEGPHARFSYLWQVCADLLGSPMGVLNDELI